MHAGPLVDLESAKELLREAVPTWEAFLDELESAGGRLKFRGELSTAISNLKISNYPLLYERPEAAGLLLMQAFMEPDEFLSFNTELMEAAPYERGEVLTEMVGQLESMEATLKFPKSVEEEVRAREAFAALDDQSKAAAIKLTQAALMAVLVMFYEYLSVAVHGEKLSSLVKRAKSGDDVAYGKAVQIDGRILSSVPFFKDRYDRASTEDDEEFLSMVSRKRSAAPYKGKLTHKSLWMTFALLDDCGLLWSVRREDLLDLCNEVGIATKGEQLEDVKNLNKLLDRYRRFQKGGGRSTP